MLNRLIVKIWTCVFLYFGSSPTEAITIFDHATVEITIAETATHTSVVNTQLPYHWDRQHGAVDGTAHFLMEFSVNDTDVAQAIYIPRIGNTFELILNGVVIGKMGSAGNKFEDFSKQPRYFSIPKGVLQNQNRLDIRIAAQGRRAGGLSPIFLGNEDEIGDIYTSSYRWQVTGSLVIAVVSLVLGSLTLLIWLRQRNLPYLFYAISEFLWALYMADTLIEHTPLPWPFWGLVYYLAFGLSSILIFKFSLKIMGLHQGNLKRFTDWNLLATVPLTSIGVLGGVPWMGQIWVVMTSLVLTYAGFALIYHGLRSESLEKRVLALSILIIAIAEIRDLFVISLRNLDNISPVMSNFGIIVWLRYAWPIFGISLAWIIAERMRASAQEIANTNQTLLQRLAQREAELNFVFVKQTNVERHQSMLEERQRITRDMHDGLGAQLLSTMHMAQDPAVSKEMLNMQLRDTLDHLKLTVDAMQDTEGDIGTLLGSIRYRLGPRLAAAGISLTWSVGSLPAITRWSLQNSRDLQMILFEAFSNMIAHAAASNAQLRAEYDLNSDTIHILLQDDGCGFDTHRAAFSKGNGLLNMRTRAASLSAEFAISSLAPALSTLEPASAGTRIELTIACNDLAPQAS